MLSHVMPLLSSLQADLCVPRLNEGDQVVLINGRDISDHTHDQVVMFIKASCESHSGELILLVRPNGELFAFRSAVKCFSVNKCKRCFSFFFTSSSSSEHFNVRLTSMMLLSLQQMAHLGLYRFTCVII